MKTAGELRNPRKFPQVMFAREFLAACGATDVDITVKGHLHIRWTIGGKPAQITLACTPACVEDTINRARQMIRRRYVEAGMAHCIPKHGR